MFTCFNVQKKRYFSHTVCLNIPVFTLCLKRTVLTPGAPLEKVVLKPWVEILRLTAIYSIEPACDIGRGAKSE